MDKVSTFNWIFENTNRWFRRKCLGGY